MVRVRVALIIGYSINERQNNVLPATFKTNVQTLIDLFKAGNASINIILKTPVPSGSTGLIRPSFSGRSPAMDDPWQGCRRCWCTVAPMEN